MSRHPALNLSDDRDPIELADLVDRPTRYELAGPADGCTGMPWCSCVDCERVPAGGHFAHEVNDFGMEDW
jgi:hypothetical protein